jgi:CHAD domain-containing protein
LSPNGFIRDYQKAARRLERAFDLLLENSGEAEVHEARTSARKMIIHLKLLPKKIREKGKVRKLEKKLEDVMDATSELRDIDIITLKLVSEGKSADGLVKHAERKRQVYLQAALEAVSSARKRKIPRLDEKDISPSGLRSRFEQVRDSLEGEIEELIPVVARDSADLESLHQLRIDSRKLRYAFESLSSKDSALRRIEGLQDKLGSIHDWDISIEFVIKSESDNKLIPEWEAIRKKEYQELVNTLNEGRVPAPESR